MYYSEELADSMGVSAEDRVKLDDAYVSLLHVFKHPEEYGNPGAEHAVTELEFELQALWGFPQDPRFHKYQQHIKGCTCPRLDNLDLIGYDAQRYRVSDCPWHWVEPEPSARIPRQWDKKED